VYSEFETSQLFSCDGYVSKCVRWESSLSNVSELERKGVGGVVFDFGWYRTRVGL